MLIDNGLLAIVGTGLMVLAALVRWTTRHDP
jgi:hypothetical protein